jgi:hypothetical protein
VPTADGRSPPIRRLPLSRTAALAGLQPLACEVTDVLVTVFGEAQ